MQEHEGGQGSAIYYLGKESLVRVSGMCKGSGSNSQKITEESGWITGHPGVQGWDGVEGDDDKKKNWVPI